MRSSKLMATALLLIGLLAGCTAPAASTAPEPTGPAASPTAPGASPTVENPIAGPSDGGGKMSPSLEVPPPPD